MKYLLMIVLITLGLTAAAEEKEVILDLDDVDLQFFIPPVVFDWINNGISWLSAHAPKIGEFISKGFNWVIGHAPQITNFITQKLQQKINNIPISEALKDWVKNNVQPVAKELYKKVVNKSSKKK